MLHWQAWCHTWIVRVGHHFEHLAVATYSFCEVCGFHSGLWYLSLALIILGTLGFVFEWFEGGDGEATKEAVTSLEHLVIK